MIGAHSIAKLYGDVVILRDASLQLRDGERAALVGPNGAGKSTLLRIIAGEIPPERGHVAIGTGQRAAYLPQDAGVEPGRTVHEEMASVFGRIAEIEARQAQVEREMSDLSPEDPTLLTLVDEQAALLADFERLDGYTVEAKIGTVLAGLGFARSDWTRPTAEFSGGWQMRIALAKLLLQEPDVLLLDEPTNHLDLTATEWLEEYLVQSGAAALIVSHDRYFLDRVTRRTFELRDGQIVDFPMPYSRYVEERARRDQEQLAAYERQQEYLAKQQAYVDRFRASATKSSGAKSREKMLGRIERIERPVADQRIAFRFLAARPSGREVVDVAGATKSYGERVVLERVGVAIERDERIGLVGPNGAGKSTLLRLIAGVERPERGRVSHGHNVQIAYYSQTQAESLDPNRTVLAEIEAAAPPGATQTELRTLLGRFLFSDEDVFKKIAVLSGGERSRLALARLLLRPANLLLLDEPTNHLDIAAREVLEAALRAFDGTVVIASHDRYLLDRVATRILEVGGGGVRSFLGNYTRYRERRAQLSAAPAAAAPSPVALTPEKPVSSTERRVRPEREAREAASRIAGLEAQVERLGARRAELEARLADPELWSCPEEASRIVDELTRVQVEIDSATIRWEQLVGAT